MPPEVNYEQLMEEDDPADICKGAAGGECPGSASALWGDTLSVTQAASMDIFPIPIQC